MRKLLAEQVVSGSGDSPLDALVEQLWRTPVASGGVRVVVNPRTSPEWHDVERYWVLPSAARPQLLIPRGNRAVTAAALLSYRALRPRKIRLGRTGLGLAASCGLPPSMDTLSVQEKSAAPGTVALPLAEISRSMGRGPLAAAIGIRLGDNRKPTLQLFDAKGSPAGYAKLAWNDSSKVFIRTEQDALASLSGGSENMRVPALAGTGTWDGYPYLVSTPLPRDVHAVRGGVGKPTAQEMFSLCAVHRHDHVAGTAHFAALCRRLGGLSGTSDGSGGKLAAATDRVERLLRARNVLVPVASRWHGDMVPWNMAREPSGTLWCWDWETAEPDAVAGLDAWHWAVSVRRESRSTFHSEDWDAAAGDIEPYLRAAAIPREAWADVAAVYALVVAERAWSLALANGGWEASWLSPDDLVSILDKAATVLDTDPSVLDDGLGVLDSTAGEPD